LIKIKKSITSYISVILVSVITAMLLIIIFFENRRFYSFTIEKVRGDINSSFEEISEILILPLWTIDNLSVTKIGETFSNNPNVLEIIINNSSDEIIYEFSKNSKKHFDSKNHIIKSTDIYYQNFYLGKLYIKFTLEEYTSSFNYVFVLSLLIWVITIMAIIIIVNFIMRKVLKNSINNLFEIMDKISEGNYNISEKSIKYFEIIEILNKYIKIANNLKKREWEIKKSNEELKKAYEAKNVLISKVSHELRTPLIGIISGSELGKKCELAQEKDEYFNIVLDSGKRLLPIIENLLNLSDIENGNMRINENRFTFEVFFDKIINKFVKEIKEKNLDFIFSYDSKLKKCFISDEEKICGIIEKLINNSIKYTEKGFIKIEASLLEIIEEENNIYYKVIFSIADSGIGIKTENIGNVFEPFNQSEEYMTRRFGGTGVGLSICKNLVELMGGKIWIEKTNEKGTNISFSINLKLNL